MFAKAAWTDEMGLGHPGLVLIDLTDKCDKNYSKFFDVSACVRRRSVTQKKRPTMANILFQDPRKTARKRSAWIQHDRRINRSGAAQLGSARRFQCSE